MKKANTQLLLGVVAGAIGTRLLGSKIGDLLPASIPSSFANVIPIAAGIYLTTNKSDFAKGAGYGAIAAGGSRFLGELIPALGAREFRPVQRTLGMPANQSILSFPANQSVMSGVHTSASVRNGSVEPKYH